MVKRGIGLLLASLSIFLAAGVNAQVPRSLMPELADYLPPINPLPNWYEVRGARWEVPVDVLVEIAMRTERELGTGRSIISNGYTMQYQGQLQHEDRTVKLMGACRRDGWTPAMLSHQFLEMLGGGECYFNATYDMKSKDFTHFSYNASR